MTRHSLGFLLSERAKAQKQFVPLVVPQQDDVTEQNLSTNGTQQLALEVASDGAIVNRDATPDTNGQMNALQHEEHGTQQ